jgi:hypothetical protein
MCVIEDSIDSFEKSLSKKKEICLIFWNLAYVLKTYSTCIVVFFKSLDLILLSLSHKKLGIK